MTFFLRKLIEALLLPLGLGIFLILAGLVFRRRRWPLLGVAILIVAAIPVIGVDLMAPLEKVWPARSIAESPAADAVVVLSGSIVRGIAPEGIQWGDAANRFFTAVDLKLAGKGRFLVLTDGPDAEHPGSTDTRLMRAEAIRRGVPENEILVTGRVLTTEDEARAVAVLPGIHHIVLVTSATHMPRSKMLFTAFGLQVEPFPTDHHHFANQRIRSYDLIPTAQGYRDTEVALREYYGLAAYWVLLTVHPPALPKISPAAAAGEFSPQ